MDASSFPDIEIATPFKNEGYALVGAAFEVHRTIGGGLLEEVYQECLEMELAARGSPFVAKQALTIYYKGQQLRKCYIPDLCVYGGVVVELKAVGEFLPEHVAQLMNYMRLARKPVGYLLNFAPLDKLRWQRFIL